LSDQFPKITTDGKSGDQESIFFGGPFISDESRVQTFAPAIEALVGRFTALTSN
jgi:hypothetical protein